MASVAASAGDATLGMLPLMTSSSDHLTRRRSPATLSPQASIVLTASAQMGPLLFPGGVERCWYGTPPARIPWLRPTPTSLPGKQGQWRMRQRGRRRQSMPTWSPATTSYLWLWRPWECLVLRRGPFCETWAVALRTLLWSPCPTTTSCKGSAWRCSEAILLLS